MGYEAVSVTAVLEEDGTEVDDDDYLSFLSENPVILLLKDGEEWAHPSHSRGKIVISKRLSKTILKATLS